MANANKPAETKSAPSEADMISNEKAAWDSVQKKDYDVFGKLLANEYTEVTDEGVFDKAGTMTSVKELSISDVSYTDWKTQSIDKDAYIITYNVTVKGTAKGEEFPPGPYRAAAAWVNRDGKWLAMFFQQTPVMPEPQPTPTPAKSASPKATESPVSPVKVETGPDAIANEKLVWDLFKSRSFDAFASLLAPEFHELEPTGFHDKAGSVRGVSMIDASQFELSDWKAVKFDDDASLVTYVVTVKGPKPEKERHSTIWANHDGKWVALLHIGTPEAKPDSKKD
jgi:hypothetical protein